MSAAAAGGLGRVLAVDDTPAILDFLRSVLEPAGYPVFVAKNGLRCLELVRKVNPSMILLDVMMPELDGYETCRRLKSSPETARIPVVFLSALASGFDVAKAFELGAADYVTKPVEPAELLARVRSQLALAELERLKERETIELEALVAERTVELASAMDERDLLLREINHRVRNNLQILSAIIGQQISLRSPGSAELQKLLGRMEAFSFAYDHLWASRRVDGIGMKPYLEFIANSVVDSAGRRGLKPVVSVEPLVFPIDAALPCGLMARELLDNAVRYAYGEAGGPIRLSLAGSDGRCELRVSDDGSGVAEELRAGAPGLGLRFVGALAAQLDATVSYEGPGGFAVRVSFPRPASMAGT